MSQTKMIDAISQSLKLQPWQVEQTVQLLDDGKTIPFIARYRKEATGELDELKLRMIYVKAAYFRKLETRKAEVINAIEESGKLTDTLRAEIEAADTLQQVEDLYLPYKKRKKTRADKARDKGLQPVADFLTSALHTDSSLLANYLDPEKDLETEEDVLQGAMDILAEDITNCIPARDFVREQLNKRGVLVAAKMENADDPKQIYKDYYEFQQRIKFLPPYRTLAINRGERENVLKVKLELENPPLHVIAKIMEWKPRLAYFEHLEKTIQDSFSRLLFPSIEREIRTRLKEEAELRAIQVFTKNLRYMMLAPPLKKKRILGLDPGFRTGCKVAIVDEHGDFVDHTVIYPTPPRKDVEGSRRMLDDLVQQYQIEIISIGNGTASRETEEFVAEWIQDRQNGLSYVITSEAGASVYSASATAMEEFPLLDVTTRGAISIARRVQDPLDELVKIPPESIGVGMYQHDVNATLLKEQLDQEVESVVNYVGVDLNKASSFLLAYISGLNKKTARAIVEHRQDNGPFQNREELNQVKGIGPKAFEQAAGFCRVPESPNPLDNTIVHPESYTVAETLLSKIDMDLDRFHQQRTEARQALRKLDTAELAQETELNPITIKTVLQALTAMYMDPRDAYPQPILKTGVRSLEDLEEGMELQGTIRNVVDFGAFVDIGVKVDGLIHKSHMGVQVQDPLEKVYTGQIVNVRILSIDTQRERIGLALEQ